MKLSFVIPCYNEEKALPFTVERLSAVLTNLSVLGLVDETPEIILVDDGSRDETWSVIEAFSSRYPHIRGLKLARNAGHQNALLAGLSEAKGQAVISLDADLQDDVSVIEEMVRKHKEGFQIVYGVRKSRESDPLFKKLTAKLFYKTINKLGAEIIPDHADFRLLGRQALDALLQFNEYHFFIRGIVPLLGFKSTKVYYERAPRVAGETKYPLPRMLAFATNAITSFSVIPLRLIAIMGFLLFLGSLGILAWVIAVRFGTGDAVPGWASTMIPLTFLGGLQLFALGVVGEYIGKIYEEVKARPKYIIEKTTTQI